MAHLRVPRGEALVFQTDSEGSTPSTRSIAVVVQRLRHLFRKEGTRVQLSPTAPMLVVVLGREHRTCNADRRFDSDDQLHSRIG